MIRKSILFIIGFVTGITALALWRELRPFPLGADAYPYAREVAGTEAPVTVPIVVSTSTATSSTVEIATTSSMSTTTTTNLYLAPQTAGASVTVEHVRLTESGWIAVHEMKNGVPANVLGAVRRDAGDYTMVSVPLLRPTVSGGAYRVILYADNGDKEFSLRLDTPMMQAPNITTQVEFTTL